MSSLETGWEMRSLNFRITPNMLNILEKGNLSDIVIEDLFAVANDLKNIGSSMNDDYLVVNRLMYIRKRVMTEIGDRTIMEAVNEQHS
jgi:hypothetical protein